MYLVSVRQAPFFSFVSRIKVTFEQLTSGVSGRDWENLGWIGLLFSLYSLGQAADVVIFLDCCFAGQAVRSRTAHNVEFLAATDKDQFTPTGTIADRPSFTSVLSAQLVELLQRQGGVTVSGLQNQMLNANLKLAKQPFYAALSQGSPAGRIRLARWEKIPPVLLGSRQEPANSEVAAAEATSLFMQLSLCASLNADDRQGLSKWLTRDSPSAVRDIQLLDQAVCSAEMVQNVGKVVVNSRKPTKKDNSRTILSEQAQQEASRLLEVLRDSLVLSEASQFTDIDVVQTIDTINRNCVDLAEFLADCLASLEADSLESLGIRNVYSMEDLSSRVAMRLSLLRDDISKDMCRVDFEDRAQPRQQLRAGKQAGAGVLVECWQYDDVNEEAFARISNQVARVSVLLAENKSEAFRILRGRGYLHEVLFERRFGIVYEIPPDKEGRPFTNFSKLIADIKVVLLDLRYRLAYCLCNAILHLHSIGWFQSHHSHQCDTVQQSFIASQQHYRFREL